MLRPVVDWEICEACDPCQARSVCKPRAIGKLGPGEPMYIELSRCNGCGLCVLSCRCGAIKMNFSSVINSSNDSCLPLS